MKFQIKAKDQLARSGRLFFNHGEIETPALVPFNQYIITETASGVTENNQIIAVDTLQLMQRPGAEVIGHYQGLQQFMNWSAPIISNSISFSQLNSQKIIKVEEEGVHFRSSIDGAKMFITPEQLIALQHQLNADVITTLDAFFAPIKNEAVVEKAQALSLRWALRCKTAHGTNPNALFAVVPLQQNSLKNIEYVKALQEIGFDGFAFRPINPEQPAIASYDLFESILNNDKPRYLSAPLTLKEVINGVRAGIDLFNGRFLFDQANQGQLITAEGLIEINDRQYKLDGQPIEQGCDCYTCQHYTRAYVHHLTTCQEILAIRLNTLHNLRYYQRFMFNLRRAIEQGKLNNFI